ncbi:hypothetical protein [Soonwooa sp.]|uniref:hypothetical protein n=1 Tax=Soonwooa sp. TaxID=1938592 RepID=UPI0028A59D5C|nr:hypothetical protein [Soonwooa sp.]
MNPTSIILLFIIVISFYFALRITKKITSKSDKRKIWESGFLFLFTFLIVGCFNLFSIFYSYTVIWEKAFRAVVEQKHEAVVVDYVVEKSYRQNFRNSSYYPVLIYFPVVKYKNDRGTEIKKKLDVAKNHPYKIGQTIKISANDVSKNANSIEFEPLLTLTAILLTTVAMFFFVLVASYGFDKTMKERVEMARSISVILLLINGIISLWMYFVI